MTGRELRDLRFRLGVTQEALARRLGVTLSTVARWEGGSRPISESRAFAIRAAARLLASDSDEES